MTTPAETTVLDLIDSRLKNNISVANGYSFSFKKVTRAKIGGFKTHEYPVVNYWPARHSVRTNEYGQDSHTLVIIMDARILTRDGNFADRAAILIAEVFTGVMRTETDPTIADAVDLGLGGTVEEILLSDAGYQIGSGDSPWCGAAIEIEIKYTSPLGDLFTINTP
jgi:hypothetical protein